MMIILGLCDYIIKYFFVEHKQFEFLYDDGKVFHHSFRNVRTFYV